MSIDVLDAFPEAEAVGVALVVRGLTIAVAESCTGGLLGAALTAVAGSSEWVNGGVIAYSNDLKVKLLGVDQAVIDAEGAVSEQVALAMARGVRRATDSDYGVAVTGIAGPDGGTDDKPVGRIHIAVAGPDGELAIVLDGDNGREANRARAVAAACELVVDACGAATPST